MSSEPKVGGNGGEYGKAENPYLNQSVVNCLFHIKSWALY